MSNIFAEFDGPEVVALEAWLGEHLSQLPQGGNQGMPQPRRGRSATGQTSKALQRANPAATQPIPKIGERADIKDNRKTNDAKIATHRSQGLMGWAKTRGQMFGIRTMSGAGIPLGGGLYGAMLSGNPALIAASLAYGLTVQQLNNAENQTKDQRISMAESVGGRRASMANPWVPFSTTQLEGEGRNMGSFGGNRNWIDYYSGAKLPIQAAKTWMKGLSETWSFEETNRLTKREVWGNLIQSESPTERRVNNIERERFDKYVERGGTNYGGWGKIPEVAGG